MGPFAKFTDICKQNKLQRLMMQVKDDDDAVVGDRFVSMKTECLSLPREPFVFGSYIDKIWVGPKPQLLFR
jgi:hypothetical protein